MSQSTVSRVLSGKAEGARITPATQDRVRSVASQLGYLPGQNTRFQPRPLTGGGQQAAVAAPVAGRVIGLVISLASPASTLALIPCQEPGLAAAGFTIVMVTLPADPLLAQSRITALTRSGVAGLLCCPSVYSTVTASAAGACPVTAISPWSADSLLKLMGAVVAEAPILPPVVVVPEPIIPVVAPVEPVVVTEPVISVVVPVEPMVATPVTESPVVTQEAAPVEVMPVITEPVAETPIEPVPALVEPEPQPTQPPEVAVVVEPVAAPEPAPVMPEPEPVSPVPAEPVATVIPTPEVITNPLPQAEQPRPADGSEPIPDDPGRNKGKEQGTPQSDAVKI